MISGVILGFRLRGLQHRICFTQLVTMFLNFHGIFFFFYSGTSLLVLRVSFPTHLSLKEKNGRPYVFLKIIFGNTTTQPENNRSFFWFSRPKRLYAWPQINISKIS